jgi:hypothetical protein
MQSIIFAYDFGLKKIISLTCRWMVIPVITTASFEIQIMPKLKSKL